MLRSEEITTNSCVLESSHVDGLELSFSVKISESFVLSRFTIAVCCKVRQTTTRGNFDLL